MSIAVIDKAFSLLEVLARLDRELTVAELAEECRLPRPTVCRILRSLRNLGYVEQAGRGEAYGLSGRLQSLREFGRDEVLRKKAGPLMTALHARFNETVNLGLLEGLYVRYVDVVETTQPLRWIVKPGARDLFHTTALGRAIVAQLPADQRARLVRRACAGLPARGRGARREALERELAAARMRGFAEETGETVAGVACLATPLASLGEPLAAVSVSVPVHRFPPERRTLVIAALHEAIPPAVASA